MGMNQYYVINTQYIKQHLSKMNKEDIERTLCSLDLLLENIENNLLDIFKDTDKFMVEIDHSKKEISLLWDPLPSHDWKVIFDKEKNNESIYNTFMDAIDFVKHTKWGDDLIKEIQST